MKRILFLAAFMLLSMAASAQDIIVKKNGEEIRAKVEEVGERSIRYRKFTNLTGPVYSISRSEVFVIRYESGGQGHNHAARPACRSRKETGPGSRRPVAGGSLARRRPNEKRRNAQSCGNGVCAPI